MHFLKVLFFITLSLLTLNTAGAASRSSEADRERVIDQQVSYIVAGIISYSRWPEHNAPEKGCILGSTPFLAVLLDQNNHNYSYTWHYYQDLEDLGTDSCDILYLGLLSSDETNKLLFEMAGKPVLSISENDPDCDDGSLICLSLNGAGSSFQVNLDAVARSGIRIHPQVLKLGKELRTAQ